MGRRKRHNKGGRQSPATSPSRSPGVRKRRGRLLLATAVFVLVACLIWINVRPSGTSVTTSNAPQPGAAAEPKTPQGHKEPTPPAETKPADPIELARVQIDTLKNESLEIAERVVRDYPDNVDAIGMLGMTYNRFGEGAQAWECWQRALQRAPNRSDLYSAMASLANRRGEYEKALELCRRGLAKTTGTMELHRQLAQNLNSLGKPEEAVDVLRVAIEKAPGDGLNYLLLGASYSLLQDYEKAKSSYETAVKLMPEHASAHYGLSKALANLGLEEPSQQATERYEKLATEEMDAFRRRSAPENLVPQDVTNYQNKMASTCAEAAAIYAKDRKLERAEQLLRRGSQAAPRDIQCRRQLVSLLMNANRTQEAAQLCKGLIEDQPNHFWHHLALATIYGRLERFDQARAEARRAVQLAPDNEQCRGLLQQLEQRK